MPRMFDAIEDALGDVAAGRPVVVVDDEDRENEGDLIAAAELATPEMIAFFVRHTSGVLCVGMDGDRLDELALPQMVPAGDNVERQGTAFTVSVDSVDGTTTGISAADRCVTVRALADPATGPADLARPGHVFPLRSRPGGVLKRAGHTEAARDLAHLVGLTPAGLLAEVVNDDGSMARRKDLARFAFEHGLRLIAITDLIRYRHGREKLVRRVATSRLPLAGGTFTAHVYESVLDGEQHMALTMGDPEEHDAVLVRVHSECLTGDMLGSLRCDCGEQLQEALRLIEAEGVGALVYLRGHEGRGIGLGHKIRAYSLQDAGDDTVQANLSLRLPVDSREYGIGAQILADLGVSRMRLMTNNPIKRDNLSGFGLEVVERVPLIVAPNPENVRYLATKRERMGHLLDLTEHHTEEEASRCGGPGR